jgi:hypothetical protein
MPVGSYNQIEKDVEIPVSDQPYIHLGVLVGPTVYENPNGGPTAADIF